MAKIGVQFSNDQRARYKFVADPLIAMGVDVTLFSTTGAVTLMRSVGYLLVQRPACLILISTGPKELILALVAIIVRCRVVIRTGGDFSQDLDVVARSARKSLNLRVFLWTRAMSTSTTILYRICDNFIVVNGHLAPVIRRYGGKNSNIFTVPQTSRGPEPMHRVFAPGLQQLLTVSNFRFSTKAAAAIWQIQEVSKVFSASKWKTVTFSIAGGGAHLKDIELFLKSFQLPNGLSVKLLGYVADLEPYYRNADLFIYRSNHDATPNVLLEAQRFGLPCLVNDFPAFAEIIDPDETGIIYSSAEEFEKALILLAGSPETRERMSENAMANVGAKYSVEAIGKTLVKALQKILPDQEIKSNV